jgi:hypothetical protein
LAEAQCGATDDSEQNAQDLSHAFCSLIHSAVGIRKQP